MKKLVFPLLLACSLLPAIAQNRIIQKDTLVVARDGTGDFRNIQEALFSIRAFRPEHTIVYIRKGVYKEKMEYNNTGAGAATGKRTAWAKMLTGKEAAAYTVEQVMKGCDGWSPARNVK